MTLVEGLREEVQALAAAVAPAGVEVWDVVLTRGRRGWLARVLLDRPAAAVTVEDCAAVNARLRARLELEGTLAGDFDLEVSSPGLDRRLRGRDDFVRFRGCLARFKVSEGLRPEAVVGRIVGVEDEGLTLDAAAGRRLVAWDAVAEAKLEPELPGFDKKTPAPNKNRARRRKSRR